MLHKTQPDFNDVLNSVKNNIFSSIVCNNIGKIIEFNPDTQRAEVELMQIKEYNGNYYPNAIISDVPVIMFGSSTAQITLPDLTGTICLLITLDRNYDAFMETGEAYAPETARMHNITDCIALTTFSTLNNPIQNYDDEAISIIYKKIVNEVLYNAVIKNYGNSLLLQVTNDINTSQIKVSDTINIQNSAQNLAVLIQTLITTIKTLTITNNAVSQTSRDALDSIAAQFGELLQ